MRHAPHRNLDDRLIQYAHIYAGSRDDALTLPHQNRDWHSNRRIIDMRFIAVGTGAVFAFYKGGVLAGCLLALLGLLLKGRASLPSTDRQNAIRFLPLLLLTAWVSGGCATSPGAV